MSKGRSQAKLMRAKGVGSRLAYRVSMRFICSILSAGLSLGYATQSVAPRSGDLFSSYTVVNVTLEAPLADLFSKAQSEAEYAVKGVVKIADAAGHETAIENIDISVRG